MSISPPMQTRHLFALPQELQDIVFEHAYGSQENSYRFINKHMWDASERRDAHNNSSPNIRPFEHNIISEMLISKRFFVQAARAYVSSWTWNDVFIDNHTGGLQESGGIIFQWASRIDTEGPLINLPSHLPNLKDLTITLRADDWAPLEPKWAWEHQYTRSELEQMRWWRVLSEMRGLRNFQIVAGELEFDLDYPTDMQVVRFYLNCQAVEDLLKPLVTRPRLEFDDEGAAVDSDSFKPSPLYAGSAVQSSTNELRKIGVDTEIDYGLSVLYAAKGDEAFDSKLAAVASQNTAKYALAKLNGHCFHDYQVPDTMKELRETVYRDGDAMLEWIRGAKRRTGQPPSKAGLQSDAGMLSVSTNELVALIFKQQASREIFIAATFLLFGFVLALFVKQ